MSPSGTGTGKPGEQGSAGTGSTVRAQLLDLLGPVVSAAGYDLDDVCVTSAGRRSLVRVSVDADGGIDLDAIAEVSRLVSDTFDAEDPFGSGPYVLEVGSPGVDRPLTEQRHWRRAIGRLVKVEVSGAPVIGRVLQATAAGVIIEVVAGPPAKGAANKGVAGRGGTHREIDWNELGAGHIQVEFSRVDHDEEGGD